VLESYSEVHQIQKNPGNGKGKPRFMRKYFDLDKIWDFLKLPSSFKITQLKTTVFKSDEKGWERSRPLLKTLKGLDPL
jgi:hypothetical protein